MLLPRGHVGMVMCDGADDQAIMMTGSGPRILINIFNCPDTSSIASVHHQLLNPAPCSRRGNNKGVNKI